MSSWPTASASRADSLYPLTVGRATLAACRAAYDRWSARADADLPLYLDAALAALAAGFQPAKIQASGQALNEHVGDGWRAEPRLLPTGSQADPASADEADSPTGRRTDDVTPVK